jgi:hypothetical protein
VYIARRKKLAIRGIPQGTEESAQTGYVRGGWVQIQTAAKTVRAVFGGRLYPEFWPQPSDIS